MHLFFINNANIILILKVIYGKKKMFVALAVKNKSSNLQC